MLPPLNSNNEVGITVLVAVCSRRVLYASRSREKKGKKVQIRSCPFALRLRLRPTVLDARFNLPSYRTRKRRRTDAGQAGETVDAAVS